MERAALDHGLMRSLDPARLKVKGQINAPSNRHPVLLAIAYLLFCIWAHPP